MIPKTSEICQ